MIKYEEIKKMTKDALENERAEMKERAIKDLTDGSSYHSIVSAASRGLNACTLEFSAKEKTQYLRIMADILRKEGFVADVRDEERQRIYVSW